jgi:uncharacterized cupin superfamily protein
MPRIDLKTAREVIGCGYPEPYDGPCRTRRRLTLGDAAGLTQFGVNLLRLEAGGWSSQRHWHSAEDEFLIVISGEVQLVTDQGEETLRAGDCAGFRAGDRNAHHLRNGSDGEAVILEVGSRKPDEDTVHYPDIDMIWEPGSGPAHKDGRPY